MTQPPQFNNVQESTTKDLGFKTSSLTGSGSQNSKGQEFAKLLLTGIKAVGTVIDANYTANQRDAQKQNQLIAQNNLEDTVLYADLESKYEKYQVDKNYSALSGKAQYDATNEFFASTLPNYKFHNEASFTAKTNTLMNKELQKHQAKDIEEVKSNAKTFISNITRTNGLTEDGVNDLVATYGHLFPNLKEEVYKGQVDYFDSILVEKKDELINQGIQTEEGLKAQFPILTKDTRYTEQFSKNIYSIVEESLKKDKENSFNRLITNMGTNAEVDVVRHMQKNHNMTTYEIYNDSIVKVAIEDKELSSIVKDRLNGIYSTVTQNDYSEAKINHYMQNELNTLVNKGDVKQAIGVANKSGTKIDAFESRINRFTLDTLMDEVTPQHIEDFQFVNSIQKAGYVIQDDKKRIMVNDIEYAGRILGYDTTTKEGLTGAFNAYSALKDSKIVVDMNKLNAEISDQIDDDENFGLKEAIKEQAIDFIKLGKNNSYKDAIAMATNNVKAMSQNTGGFLLHKVGISTQKQYELLKGAVGGNDVKTITALDNSLIVTKSNGSVRIFQQGDVDNILAGKAINNVGQTYLFKAPEPISKNTPVIYDDSAKKTPQQLVKENDIVTKYEVREGFKPKVYNDGKGNKTVGYGFNMSQEGARSLWKQAGIKESFDSVEDGKALSKESSKRLLYFMENISVNRVKNEAKRQGVKYESLTYEQKEVLTDIAYNYGSIRKEHLKIFHTKDINSIKSIYESIRPKGDTRSAKIFSSLQPKKKEENKGLFETGKFQYLTK